MFTTFRFTGLNSYIETNTLNHSNFIKHHLVYDIPKIISYILYKNRRHKIHPSRKSDYNLSKNLATSFDVQKSNKRK